MLKALLTHTRPVLLGPIMRYPSNGDSHCDVDNNNKCDEHYNYRHPQTSLQFFYPRWLAIFYLSLYVLDDLIFLEIWKYLYKIPPLRIRTQNTPLQSSASYQLGITSLSLNIVFIMWFLPINSFFDGDPRINIFELNFLSQEGIWIYITTNLLRLFPRNKSDSFIRFFPFNILFVG